MEVFRVLEEDHGHFGYAALAWMLFAFFLTNALLYASIDREVSRSLELSVDVYVLQHFTPKFKVPVLIPPGALTGTTGEMNIEKICLSFVSQVPISHTTPLP
jgi:hypothetical protein